MVDFLAGLLLGYFAGGFTVGIVMLLLVRHSRRREAQPSGPGRSIRLTDAIVSLDPPPTVVDIDEVLRRRRPS